MGGDPRGAGRRREAVPRPVPGSVHRRADPLAGAGSRDHAGMVGGRIVDRREPALHRSRARPMRDAWAGILVGLGAAAKLSPALFLVPFIAERIRSREPDRAITLGWS